MLTRVGFELAPSGYRYSVIHKISNESKLCTLLGDYNLNLLNLESHNPTGDFVNTLASYFFQPHIIKPTRITDDSATLIDNIFFLILLKKR